LEESVKPFAAFLLCVFCTTATVRAADSYQITKKIPIPGQGGWDYLTVDEGARRLYVSHGTQVEVLDVDSGSIAGKIANTSGAHGITVAPELGRGSSAMGRRRR